MSDVFADVIDYRLRVEGAIRMLRMGYPVAARRILAGEAWPTLSEAAALQDDE